ncbi:MAG: cation transporter [Gemmatimonadaceae bacterium]
MISDSCCTPEHPAADDPGFTAERRVLWVALIINASMFVVELAAGGRAQSSSLQADSLDFLADAANYGISLLVVTAGLAWRSRAALLKGLSLAGLGLWVLLITGWRLYNGNMPQAEVMGAVGFLAVAANFFVLRLLMPFRQGDANRRAVWICTRNDVIGNVAVIIAATGVFTMVSAWPDALVATGLGLLGVWGGLRITRSALREQRNAGMITTLN